MPWAVDVDPAQRSFDPLSHGRPQPQMKSRGIGDVPGAARITPLAALVGVEIGRDVGNSRRVAGSVSCASPYRYAPVVAGTGRARSGFSLHWREEVVRARTVYHSFVPALDLQSDLVEGEDAPVVDDLERRDIGWRGRDGRARCAGPPRSSAAGSPAAPSGGSNSRRVASLRPRCSDRQPESRSARDEWSGARAPARAMPAASRRSRPRAAGDARPEIACAMSFILMRTTVTLPGLEVFGMLAGSRDGSGSAPRR